MPVFRATQGDEFVVKAADRGFQGAIADALKVTADGTVTVASVPITAGEVTGFTAGAGAAVLVDSTFTGNLGTTAYTISDVVKALKFLKLLAL
jgi:hypothetical protein